MKQSETAYRLKRLGAAGMAHIVAPLVIVLLVAIVGTYMLVASHADPITPVQPSFQQAPLPPPDGTQ